MNKEKTPQLGKKMKYCRHCINFERDDMCAMFNIDEDLLDDYECGEITPYILWIYRFANMFKIELNDLTDESITVEDFAVMYTDNHFKDFPFSKVNYDY